LIHAGSLCCPVWRTHIRCGSPGRRGRIALDLAWNPLLTLRRWGSLLPGRGHLLSHERPRPRVGSIVSGPAMRWRSRRYSQWWSCSSLYRLYGQGSLRSHKLIGWSCSIAGACCSVSGYLLWRWWPLPQLGHEAHVLLVHLVPRSWCWIRLGPVLSSRTSLFTVTSCVTHSSTACTHDIVCHVSLVLTLPSFMVCSSTVCTLGHPIFP